MALGQFLCSARSAPGALGGRLLQHYAVICGAMLLRRLTPSAIDRSTERHLQCSAAAYGHSDAQLLWPLDYAAIGRSTIVRHFSGGMVLVPEVFINT